MESQTLSRTIADAIPAYNWNIERTTSVVDKLTPDLAVWRPAPLDGAWHFSLGEMAAHIADAWFLFFGMLTGDQLFDRFFVVPPDDFHGQAVVWKAKRDYTLDEIKAHIVEARDLWKDVVSQPIESAHIPTAEAVKRFEEAKKLVAEGKMSERFLGGGPATPIRMIPSMIAHETGHRSSMITLLRTFHGVSFKEE